MPLPSLTAVVAAVLPVVSAAPRPSAPPAVAGTYSGRLGETNVAPPRVEGPAAEVRVDGLLDEAVWQGAARLTGFSQFAPTDGIPATDSTEVLVWYSPTAIHFGVRAFAPTGTVNATLADRDRIGGDDQVQIILSTFDDARQAMVFGVNPLGIQADGTLVETGNVTQGGFGNANAQGITRESADLSADFVYQSKGRVTPAGFEVEIRVPFKSLRYQPAPVQRWGIHVVRRVQRLGAEDSWAPARRGAASFLAQGGHLTGLERLDRGLVLDVTPTITQRTTGGIVTRGPVGAPDATSAWRYRREDPEVGGSVRWGVTNNLTLNGTVNPDFSQVEADAAQVQFDPRQALFFPERRPFFLDGIEQFTVPNGIIYTRRIVQPTVAAKVTGKVAGTDVAFLSAVDQTTPTTDALRDGHPVFNVLRVQRDVGGQSRVGVVYTDRTMRGESNRVAGADTRFVFGKVYTATAQVVGSATRDAAGDRSGALWQGVFLRNGRRFGMRYSLYGVDETFEPGAGFVGRPGIVRGTVVHRGTIFNGADALVRSVSGDVTLDGIWKYRAFTAGEDLLEKKAHFNTNAQLRGGWSGGASVLVEQFRYDPDLYANYYIAVPRASDPSVADTLPYVGTPALANLDWVLTLNTPQWRRFSATAFVIWGRDENFYEWQSSDIAYATLAATVRPTERLRIEGNYQLQRFARPSDGSVVGVRHVPRLKLEYQVARPVFVRFVGQYVAAKQDSLRDDGRTNAPIFFRTANGFERAVAQSRNTFRGDVLFSYQPNPGTVFFAGYGSTLVEPDPLRFAQLRRTVDGVFVKVSYLFRV